MKRDPSLHVTKSDLVKILGQILITSKMSKSRFADEIFKEAAPYQIKSRYLQLLEKKADLRKKVTKSLKADEGLPDKVVEIFNASLNNYRKLKDPYRKIKQITKNSSDYLLLKEIAKLAYEFADHFDIEPRTDGVEEYMKMGVDMMPRYALNKFKYYDSKIHEAFQNKLDVLNDDSPASTSEFYYLWQTRMREYSGIPMLIDIDRDFNKYVHIVYARKEADKIEADYEFWIDAQFDGLAFMNVLPEVNQFYGDGALKRFEKYLKKQIENEENKSDGGLSDYYDGNPDT